MLAVFNGAVVEVPEELVAVGSRTPSPKTTASMLVQSFVDANSPVVSVQVNSDAVLAHSHHDQSTLNPRSFAVTDDVFCLFEGMLVVSSKLEKKDSQQ